MTHISKKELNKNYLENLYIQFINTLEKSHNSNFKISYQFFTKSERIMFAKRLAAIQMLSKDFSVYAIAEALSMSPSTINLMSVRYEEGKYNQIVKGFKKNTELSDLIDLILSGGGIMPPIVGNRKNRLI